MDYRAVAIIDLDVIYNNVKYIKSRLDNNVSIMSVVKADAYGHGIADVAKKIYDIIDSYGVATMEEAAALRKNGIDKEILVLGEVYNQELEYASANNISVSVFSAESYERFYKYCSRTGNSLNVHIAVNTGMNRLGFEPNDFYYYNLITNYEKFNIKGVYSHFGDSKNPEFTAMQNERFEKVRDYFINHLNKKPLFHIASSHTALDGKYSYDCVRLGILQYNNEDYFKTPLKTAMNLKAKVIQIREISSGEYVGYNKGYRVWENTRIACVSIGYADGLPLSIKNGGKVEYNGRYFDIIAVCMDYVLIDLKNDKKLSVGNYVNIYGNMLNPYQQALSINESNYVLLSKNSQRVFRIFKNYK